MRLDFLRLPSEERRLYFEQAAQRRGLLPVILKKISGSAGCSGYCSVRGIATCWFSKGVHRSRKYSAQSRGFRRTSTFRCRPTS